MSGPSRARALGPWDLPLPVWPDQPPMPITYELMVHFCELCGDEAAWGLASVRIHPDDVEAMTREMRARDAFLGSQMFWPGRRFGAVVAPWGLVEVDEDEDVTRGTVEPGRRHV